MSGAGQLRTRWSDWVVALTVVAATMAALFWCKIWLDARILPMLGSDAARSGFRDFSGAGVAVAGLLTAAMRLGRLWRGPASARRADPRVGMDTILALVGSVAALGFAVLLELSRPGGLSHENDRLFGAIATVTECSVLVCAITSIVTLGLHAFGMRDESAVPGDPVVVRPRSTQLRRSLG